MRRLTLLALLALAVVPSAGAATNPTLLGIKGDAARFRTLTGQDSQVWHAIIGRGRATRT